MASSRTKVMAVRIENQLAEMVAQMASHERQTLSRHLRRAISAYLGLTAIDRAELFCVESTKALGELRRIGGLAALAIKSGKPLPEPLAQELELALKTLIEATKAGYNLRASASRK